LDITMNYAKSLWTRTHVSCYSYNKDRK